jgi:hypothetical protein
VTAQAALRGNWPFLVVALLAAGGALSTVIAPQHWLRGVMISAVGLAVGAIERLTLPADRVGMLAVRGRSVDVLCLATLAVLIVTVAILLPH